MKKIKMAVKTFVISIFLFMVMVTSASAKPSNEFTANNHPNLGTWQGIVDGKQGEGSFFYRFNFREDGTVTVIKQNGGHDEKEDKTWKKSGDNLKITSGPNANIVDFDKGEQVLFKFIDAKTIAYKDGFYETDFKEHKNGIAFVHWILILVVLMALNEIFRRFKFPTIIFYFILPFALIPLWASHGVSYWFKWAKVYSVVTACIWFTCMRYTKLSKRVFPRLIAGMFIALNITEAVTQDFSLGFAPNILNGIAGILSIITLFYGWKGIHIDNSKEHDMVWPKMTVLWILAYDVWNFVFVYLNFPGSASAQFMVILSCTIPSLFIKKGTWLQARAFTLAAWFMYYFTAPRFTESMELHVPRNASLSMTVALISITLNILCAVAFFRNMRNDKNDSKDKLFGITM
ncbi:DUF5692 family protein [Clostridium estertheticum]|uniref:DUF5692 family protein n=1 Tax=Clostridium estertheticum TaxID=238834 RepID=UPI0013E9405B|nr:DUF5692 family protein [Clostridium estertheticum]MBZ9685931.1 DUF5692 family protein [Clostridium estertheticum]